MPQYFSADKRTIDKLGNGGLRLALLSCEVDCLIRSSVTDFAVCA